jgi:acyl carrier protein
MTLEAAALLRHLGEKIHVAPDQIESDMTLISSGLIDSFSMVELVLFIEQQCGIKVKPTEVNLDNLDSVERILAFAEARTNEKKVVH